MTGAFVYLTVCSIRNLVRVRLRRLRQPRYLIGLIAGLVYFSFIFLQPGSRGSGVLTFIGRNRPGVEIAGAGLLFVLAALAWVLPRSKRPALAFLPAEVQFLFTAPVTRRQLIEYKLLRSQLAGVLGSALMTFFFRPASVEIGWIFFLGMLILTSTLSMHLTGVSLSRESLHKHGAPALARQWAPIALVAGAAIVAAVTAARHWDEVSAIGSPAAAFEVMERLGGSGPLGVVLWPFRAIVRVPLSSSAGDFLRALPVAIGLLAVNFLWVVRSDAAFEEASVELAGRIARYRERPLAVAYRARPVPFVLALSGRPDTAILWKNLILIGRFASWRLLVTVLPLIVFLGVLFGLGTGGEEMADRVAIVCVIFLILTITLGPQMVRNDLRQDLTYLPVLKSWPVPGRAIVRGEVLAPTIVLSSIAGVLIVAICIWTRTDAAPIFDSIAGRVTAGLAALSVLPGLIGLQVVTQNALAVVFPGWVTIGPAHAAGIDVMGQRLITTMAMLFALPVLALPAAFVAALVAGALYAGTGTVPILGPALAAAAVLIGECWLATTLLGRQFDRTDPSDV
jgi:hypothetical protein